jgi:hypothetical protein
VKWCWFGLVQVRNNVIYVGHAWSVIFYVEPKGSMLFYESKQSVNDGRDLI